uniref:GDP/GTP exchange factor Sec2 N-terminal domain-containing protein n=2 Tax=Timema TaxID=61471 RepID=A0A7R9CUR3_TIMCR|nr:unnamed protein product [Timema cristinae]
MKAIDVPPPSADLPPRKNGFLNEHQSSTDEDDDPTLGSTRAKFIPSSEDFNMTNGSVTPLLKISSDQKKSLIATLVGTHVKTDEYPALNGSVSTYETVRINHIGTRLTDDGAFNGIRVIGDPKLPNGDRRKSGSDDIQRQESLTSNEKSTVGSKVRSEEDCISLNGCVRQVKGSSSNTVNGDAHEGECTDLGYSHNGGHDLTNGDISEVDGTQLLSSVANTWDRALADMKEQAFSRLQDELQKAHQELKLRDEEVTRLSRIREEVESELEELTASLFQEAHNMVREANVRQAAAEKSFKESQMQVEVLVAEVAALKTLVLTSTPSRPNPHLHPQIDPNRAKDDASISGVSLFTRKHRRSPSHFNLKYGRENSPPESPVKECRTSLPDPVISDSKDGYEVDPLVHREFVSWKQGPSMNKSDPFIARIYSEDIDLCLDFSNKDLSNSVRAAIEAGNIFIEAVDKAKTIFPKKCALLEAPRQCHYRMKLGDQEQWHCISQICRNRVGIYHIEKG